jgi:hypothetical protein
MERRKLVIKAKQYAEYNRKLKRKALKRVIDLYKKKPKPVVVESRQYGLVKGQSVKRHKRTDPRTGQKFVAGRGGVGSPVSVLAEGKTVSPGKVAGEAGNILGVGDLESINPEKFMPEGTIYHPETLQTIIRNLENATVDQLTTMFNELFTQPSSRERGILAELMLKEIFQRGIKEPETETKEGEGESKDSNGG